MTQDEKLDYIIQQNSELTEQVQALQDQLEELRDAIADKEISGPGYHIDNLED